jgi:hypothetical protein
LRMSGNKLRGANWFPTCPGVAHFRNDVDLAAPVIAST